ncbi:band 7 protein AGAP004871 [Tetranychus urticae]|uniref:band 7 protein AGAP004871 n=1 Tax=Tetranychus urticae TaxID=32264 RepID=UPI00077C009D|nr:band 7 protein AGAP004871 [Tetranychus urticae]
MRSNSLGNSMEGVGGGGLPPPPPSHISESMGQTSAPLRHGMGPLNALGESHSYNYQDRNFIQGKRFMGFDSTNVIEDPAYCAYSLKLISVILIITSLPFSLFFCIKVVQEYERAVIFRLGRLVTGGARGPGIFFIIPCIDTYSKVDLRTVSFDVPPQEILSKDSVTVAVDAVVYFRISNAIASVSNVEDYARSTRLLAATTLRNVLGTKNLSEILSERESISHMIQSSLDEATDSWGVKVERVEIKDVRLPVQLQRAMAAEAEAAREARAKVIAAEGEQRASRALKEAAEVIADSPAALQLRYLQTLNSIAAEKNSTIVFPVPMELFRGFVVDADHKHSSHRHHSTQETIDFGSNDDEILEGRGLESE